MKRLKKNPEIEIGDIGTFTVDVDESKDPHAWPLWYQQFMRLSESQRAKIADRAISILKDTKPETYEFIKQMKCELVGLSPRVEYAMVKGDASELEVTWVHSFSGPTLVYWCELGKFSLQVNGVLDYNDSVLNRIEGNPKSTLRGFTG